MIHASGQPADAVRRTTLRWVAAAVLVAFVLFLVVGWAHAAGALGHDHPHDHPYGHGHDAGLQHGTSCSVCDAILLAAGGALFAAFVTLLSGAAPPRADAPPLAPVRCFEPGRFASPRGPPRG